MLPYQERQRQHAFSLGSDARLKGLPRARNPYPFDAPEYLRISWFQGWEDMDRHWPKPLPALPEAS